MSQYGDSPTVSVLMPMKDARPFVRRAIDSVLSQSGVTLELIVVDDGSTDGSTEAVREIGDSRVKLISNPGEGIASAFNAALDAARGRYIARCDADDAFPADRLGEQAAWLDAHGDYGAICGAFAMLSPRGTLLCDLANAGSDQDITDELRNGTVRTHACTFLISTDVLRRLGGFRPFFRTGEDIDLQLRLGEVCSVWYESKRRYLYRLHASSITHRLGRLTTTYYDSCARRMQLQRRDRGQDDLEAGIVPPGPDESDAALSVTRHIQGVLLGTAWRQHTAGRKFRSIITGLRAGLSEPFRLDVWYSVGALIMKRAGSPSQSSASNGQDHADEPSETAPMLR